MSKEKKGNSIGFCALLGTVLAVVLSWSANHSILWAILHAFLGWFYVIYYVLCK